MNCCKLPSQQKSSLVQLLTCSDNGIESRRILSFEFQARMIVLIVLYYIQFNLCVVQQCHSRSTILGFCSTCAAREQPWELSVQCRDSDLESVRNIEYTRQAGCIRHSNKRLYVPYELKTKSILVYM